jgi:hypothetical protein
MNELVPVLAGKEITKSSSSAGEALRSLLESRTFEKTPALRSLLLYLWQHRDDAISEYAVAIEALGRPSSFDSRTDATVRVQISRLRQRLERFYEDEGQNCSERLLIPLGSHQLQFKQFPRLIESESPSRLATAPLALPAVSSHRKLVYWLAVATATLAIVCLVQTFRLHAISLSSKNAASLQHTPWFWKSFFANGKPARVTLPTPIFFSFSRPASDTKHAVMLRDTEINEFADGAQSSAFGALEKMLGRPILADNYTVTSDTFACIQLARYLDRFSLPNAVHSMADAPMDALDSENLIAVGTWGTLTPVRPYLEHLDFELGQHEESVRVRNAASGESSLIKGDSESPDRTIWPGVIAVIPGKTGQTKLLILASRYTAVLVSFLTSSNGLDQLANIWKAKGSPEYFQLVLKAEISGRGLVRSWPVVLHPYVTSP